MPVTPGRYHCCIPFCKRTRAIKPGEPVFDEWICGVHWTAVRKARRRAYGRIVRQWRRFGPSDKMTIIGQRLWRAIRREATERAVGL